MGVIDEVKQKIDIVEVIGQYTKLTKAGKTFRGLCPFHSEKHGSFFVYPEQQTWHCFGACGTGGDVLTFTMKKEGLDFGEALRLLADKAGVVVPSRSGPDESKDEKEALYRVNEAAAQYFNNLLINSPAAAKVRDYVTRRSISPSTTSAFQLGYSLDEWEALKSYLLERGYSEELMLAAGLIIKGEKGPVHDRFRGRLMFPIRDARGRTIGFGARALDDSMPKYLNSPQSIIFDKSGNLYGLDMAAGAIRQQDMVVIVEGYTDVIIAHQAGIANVLACMGTAITEKHVATLKRLSKNLVLCLDADAAGEEAMLRGVGYENRLDAEVRVIILPEGKDPDEVIIEDAAAWPKLVAGALPITDYAFDMAASGLDLTTARSKAALADKLLPLVAEITNPVRQGHYLQKLGRLVKMSDRNLEAALGRLKFKPGKPANAVKSDPVARALKAPSLDVKEQECLAFLLQCPELKSRIGEVLPEYFQASEDREIFLLWREAPDIEALRTRLDPSLNDHLNALVTKSFIKKDIEDKYTELCGSLRERFHRGVAAMRAEIYALERETGGPGADLARLEQDGIGPSQQLKEIFSRKARRGP